MLIYHVQYKTRVGKFHGVNKQLKLFEDDKKI